MDTAHRLSILVQGVSAWLGFSPVPTDPVERAARVEALYADARTGFPEVVEVRAEAVAAAVASGTDLVLVDVRTEAEQAVSMLPHAVPAGVIEREPGPWVGRRLVAYCTIGYRSGLWARDQGARGLTVENLAGGVLAWSWAGGRFVADGAPTTTVHVYGPTWDLLAPGLTSTW